MNPTGKLHSMGQRLWLDNITRELLDNGTLQNYINQYSITGLTSNPTIFDGAIASGNAYDAGIAGKSRAGKSGEKLFIELALEDLCRAADLFRPLFDTSNQLDGWVSMEISPLLANDTEGSIRAARRMYQQADRPNLFIKIPGTQAGLPAIESLIHAGVPINITLLFSCEQYLAAAQAYMRGIERRLETGLNPKVGSVASLFVSRWDVAVKDKIPASLHNKLGIAICSRVYHAWCELLDTPRWRRLADAGALPQRLLWASTGSKDPAASATLYMEALVAAGTINTVPEQTLLAFANHGILNTPMARDDGEAVSILQQFEQIGINIALLAKQLQLEGTNAFVKSWQSLLQRIADKNSALSDQGMPETSHTQKADRE